MFPGFVTIYKDAEEFVHLYFFHGIDDNGNNFYKDLNIPSNNIKYTKIINTDNSVDYKFESNKIVGIVCNLIDNNYKKHVVKLTL